MRTNTRSGDRLTNPLFEAFLKGVRRTHVARLCLLTLVLFPTVGDSQVPPMERSRQAPSQKTQLSLCTSGLSAQTGSLNYPKPQFSDCDAVKERVRSSRLSSHHYRSACETEIGGPMPASVLSATLNSCSDTGNNVVVTVDVCCPNPCVDLSKSSCNNEDVCHWGGCKWSRGSLTCSDLPALDACERYGRWCNWKQAECTKRPEVLLPFECNDLSSDDCGKHSECRQQTQCRRRSGSLTCRDLNQNQCSRYSSWCRWRRGACRKRVVAGPFECNDLNSQDCRALNECTLRTECRRRTGSLTCNDLDQSECPSYRRWCDWKPNRCIKNPFVLSRFECNDLQKPDCRGQSSCSWQERCFYEGK